MRSWPWTKTPSTDHKTAIFRQINQDNPANPPRRAGISRWSDRAADIAGTGSARHRSAVTGGGCWCYGHARSRLRLTAIGREQSASTPPTKAVLFSFGKPPAARYRIERAVIPIKGPIALRSPLQRDSHKHSCPAWPLGAAAGMCARLLHLRMKACSASQCFRASTRKPTMVVSPSALAASKRCKPSTSTKRAPSTLLGSATVSPDAARSDAAVHRGPPLEHRDMRGAYRAPGIGSSSSVSWSSLKVRQGRDLRIVCPEI